MFQSLRKLRILAIILYLVQIGIAAVCFYLFRMTAVPSIFLLVIEGVLLIITFQQFESTANEHSFGVKNTLGTAAKEAYLSGGIGMVIYNDDHVITWMSELFQERHIERVGTRVLNWIPEAEEVLNGHIDKVNVQLDDRIYEIHRKEDAPVLFFRDITELNIFENKYHNEQVVIGLAAFDNYEEETQYADDTEVANINVGIRMPLMSYCNQYGVLAKRLNNNHYLLVLNEKVFKDIAADHFSILSIVRKAAQKLDVSITLSMSFARGCDNYEDADSMATELLDLAQTRGGDQVAMQVKGQEARYFGGSTEAVEKRSRVRVRVMSHALRDLILNADNVIICGHKVADFDCIGSAVCLARMCSALKKKAVIIARTGGIEEKLNAVLDAHMDEFEDEVEFVSEAEALNQLRDKTLVIMTDHHNVRQSNGSKVLEQAKQIVVIDHHRRAADMGVKPVLLYIEASASSTCELLTEMLPYMYSHVDISELDANLMLAGIMVDTQRWRVRTGARTFDAASALRKLGADPQICNSWLKDSYNEFARKSEVTACAKNYPHDIVLVPYEKNRLSRALMSQVADDLLEIQSVAAVFVLAKDLDDKACISARSAGRINVQMIMEQMGGGGHRTAAAVQRDRSSVADLQKELLKTLDTYFKEGEPSNESNS